MNERWLQSALAPLKRRIQMMVGRAVLRAVADTGPRQTAQIELMKGEIKDRVERMQNYGMTSVPKPGAEAAVIFLGGERGTGIIIAVDDRRYRLAGLEEGEVAIYDDQGQKVHLTRAGIIIDGGGLPVTIANTPLTTIEGPLQVQGDIQCLGNIEAPAGTVGDAAGTMGEMRTAYNAHKHGTSPLTDHPMS